MSTPLPFHTVLPDASTDPLPLFGWLAANAFGPPLGITEDALPLPMAAALPTTVTSETDSGPGSLRTILGAAANGDTIIFDPSVYDVALASSLTATASVTIDGALGRDGAANVIVSGPGPLILANSDTIGNLTLASGLLLRNNGIVTQTGTLTLGALSSASTQITNAPNRTWIIGQGANILRGNNVAVFNNAGTLEQSSSSQTQINIIGARFLNISSVIGSVKISGEIEFTSPTGNDFENQIISGRVLDITAGNNVIGIGTTVSVAALQIENPGTTLTLTASVAERGVLDLVQATLNLQSYTMTASSGTNIVSAGTAARIEGSGKLVVTSGTTIGNLNIGGSVLLRANAGAIVDQTGTITLGDASNGAAQITVASGADWQVTDSMIVAGSTAAIINVGGGALYNYRDGGSVSIAPPIENLSVNTGQIENFGGSMELGGGLSGILTLAVDAKATLILDKSVTADSTVNLAGSSSALQLNDAPDFAGTIAGFASTDTIDLRSINYASATSSYINVGSNNASGYLRVSDSTKTAQLYMSGHYQVGNFQLSNDMHGGTAITFA